MKKRSNNKRIRKASPPAAGRPAELQDQLAATANQLKNRPALCRRVKSMANAYCKGTEELDLARDLQNRLLPALPPQIEGLQIAAQMIRSTEGATDLYDVFEIGEGVVGFFLAETSGGGLESALLLTLVKVAVDSARTRILSPGAIMEFVNEEVVARKATDQHLTAFLGLLDIRTCTMRYVNASDKCPIFSGEGGLKLLCTRNRFLGEASKTPFPENEIHLEPGDNFLLFTSGIGGARNRSGRAYTLERLSKLVAKNAHGQASALMDAVSTDIAKYVNGGKCPADVSLIAVRITSALAGPMKIVIATDPAQLGTVVTAVMERMKALNYGERSLFAIRLCLEEAMINAMKHGNKMDRTRKITVTCDSDAHQVALGVEDEGPGFHPEAVPDPTRPENLQLAHGRGMLLMRSYMDKVVYNAKGNRVTLIKKAPWQ